MKITIDLPDWQEIDTLNGWDQKLFFEFVLQASHFIGKEDEETVLHYMDEGHILLEKEPQKNALLLPLYRDYRPELYEKLKQKEWRKSTLADNPISAIEELSDK